MTHRNIVQTIANNDEHIVEYAYSNNTLNNVVDSIDAITQQSVNDLSLIAVRDERH